MGTGMEMGMAPLLTPVDKVEDPNESSRERLVTAPCSHYQMTNNGEIRKRNLIFPRLPM